MSINWVMLNPSGNPPFHALPKETILHATNKSISLTIESGKTLPAGDSRKKTIGCPSGTAYLTNQRIVYIPEKLSSTAELQSFAAPIKRVSDSHLTQPWFSANAFIATVTPVKSGGIPHYAELRLVFKEGGAFEFYNTYTALLDRLHASQGDGAVEHLEDLPRYSNDGVRQPVEAAAEQTGGNGNEEAEESVPDELPPAYDDVAPDEERGRSRTRY